MKKVFTLAMGLVALGASAANADFSKAPVMMANKVVGSAMQAPSLPADDMSRATLDVDLVGQYESAVYIVVTVPNTDQVSEQYIQPNGSFSIVADPEVENGYIIKNLFGEFMQETVGDVKATWNAETLTLTCEPYPLLTTINGNAVHMMTATGDQFSTSSSLVMKWERGLLQMQNPGIMLGEIRGEELWGYPYQVRTLSNCIPNGNFVYTDDEEGAYDDPIYTVKVGDQYFVFNFGFTTFLNRAIFEVEGDKFVNLTGTAQASIPAGTLLSINPAQNLYIDTAIYCCYADNAGGPVSSTDWFEMAGSIINSDENNFEVTFPRFGLFDDEDTSYGIYDNGVLKFDLSNLAGINTVAAEAAADVDAPAVYYNLQGMRVNNPENGVFIRVKGNSVEKMLMK